MRLICYGPRGMVFTDVSKADSEQLAREWPKNAFLHTFDAGRYIVSFDYERASRAYVAQSVEAIYRAIPIPDLERSRPKQKDFPPVPLKATRKAKGKATTCDCPATVARYDKKFPHKPGSVPGCHAGPDGYALDGVVRCDGMHLCRACQATQLLLESYDSQNTEGLVDRGLSYQGPRHDTRIFSGEDTDAIPYQN